MIPTVCGERLAGVRAVQAERDRRAASTRGRSRCSRSRTGAIVELTFFLDTERVFPLFGLPPAASRRRRQHVVEPHEGRRASRSSADAFRSRSRGSVTAGGELEPRERVDGHRVRLDAAHVAERDVGAARREERADAVAEAGEVARARSARGRRTRACAAHRGHRRFDRGERGNSSARAADEFRPAAASNLRHRLATAEGASR